MPAELITRQQKVYDFVVHFFEQNDFSPTLTDILERMNIQSSVVSAHLLLMQKKHVLLLSAEHIEWQRTTYVENRFST